MKDLLNNIKLISTHKLINLLSLIINFSFNDPLWDSLNLSLALCKLNASFYNRGYQAGINFGYAVFELPEEYIKDLLSCLLDMLRWNVVLDKETKLAKNEFEWVFDSFLSDLFNDKVEELPRVHPAVDEEVP